MNKRFLLKNSSGERVYCILSSEKDLQSQWEEVFSIEKGHGLSVEVYPTKVKVVNYFRGDTLARFEILSVSETDADVSTRLLAEDAEP